MSIPLCTVSSQHNHCACLHNSQVQFVYSFWFSLTALTACRAMCVCFLSAMSALPAAVVNVMFLSLDRFTPAH